MTQQLIVAMGAARPAMAVLDARDRLLNPALSGARVSWRSAVMTGLLGVGPVLLEIHKLASDVGAVSVSTAAFRGAPQRYQRIDSPGTGDE